MWLIFVKLCQAAFPAQEKRLDALILCTTEIFIYLEENLKLTPQNLSDKAAASDELEEIYQQVYSKNHYTISVFGCPNGHPRIDFGSPKSILIHFDDVWFSKIKINSCL